MKKSFTMVEIIFVIVILAIVAGGTFEFILKIYQTYARAKTVDTLQTELDLALTQISNRLAYRIKDSVIYDGFSGGVVRYLADSTSKQNDILEWISYDREGLMGMWNGSAVVPGWSGFSDRNLIKDNNLTIESLGSNLNYASQIIKFLSGESIDLNSTDASTNSRVAVIIPSDDGVQRYGWYGGEGNNSFIVNCRDGGCNNGEGNLTISADDPEYISANINYNFGDRNDTDRYYLAWSAYAIERNTTNNDLYLYYNYQPWTSSDPNVYGEGKQSILLKNVNLFEFWQNGNTIWVRICIDSENQDTLSLEDDSKYGFCKERAIY